MKTKCRFFLFSLAIAGTQAIMGQIKEAGFDSFTISAPDTITQGEPFQMTYILSASTWDSGGAPKEEKGFRLTDVTYTTEAGRPYSRLYTKATYITSRTGLVELPSMVMRIHQREVKSAPKTIYVKPHPRYGKEMTVAHDWLVKHGMHPNSLSLEKALEDENFWIFHDKKSNCFCIVATKDVWTLVGNPVLAYSTESFIGGNSDNQSFQQLILPYKKQIKALKASVNKNIFVEKPFYSPKHNSVTPLLGKLAWGQDTPYNLYAPTLNGKKVILGCVPIAVAMIMNYYQWPKQGRSHVYHQSNNQLYKIDFSQCSPQWSTYQTHYQNQETTEIANLSEFLTSLSASLDAQFGDKGTSASCSNVKHVLCNNFDYSGKMTFYHHLLTDNETVSFIYQELDQQRPCIVTNDGHAFVCDGYEGEFLHYNLGWYGSYNGFYRLKLGNYTPLEGDTHILITGVLGGIEPQRNGMSRKEVTLATAGTLAEMLSEQEKETLTHLSITGPINSADIRLLRKMAGAINEKPLESWRGGSLRTLNLTHATIEDDPQPYLTQKATGTRSRITSRTYSNGTTTKKTFSFNFEKMTEKEWKDFLTIIGDTVDGGYYTRTDDNKYWMNYTCVNNEIGNHMFDGCSSLHEIFLPENTQRIGNYAFMGCSSIQNIRIPKGVQEVGTIPFNRCTSLESMESPRELSIQHVLYDKCSPLLKNVKQY